MLLDLGMRCEERIALLLPDSPPWAYVFFGAMKIGAVAMPMNTMLTAKDYEYLLNDSRARVLVVHAALREASIPFAGNSATWRTSSSSGDEPAGPSVFRARDAGRPRRCLEPADTNKDDMAFWLYSSGTTGFPKGAIHLHHDMIVAADCYARGNDRPGRKRTSRSRWRSCSSPTGWATACIFRCAPAARPCCCPNVPRRRAVFRTIDRYRPTVFYSVPTSYAATLHEAERSGRTSLGDVRMCVSAGETLPRHLFLRWRERFGVEILDGIGSTEILHIFISNRPGQAGPAAPGKSCRASRRGSSTTTATTCRSAPWATC